MDTEVVFVLVIATVMLTAEYACGLRIDAVDTLDVPESAAVPGNVITDVTTTDVDGEATFTVDDNRFQAIKTDPGADIKMVDNSEGLDFETLTVNPFTLNIRVSDDKNTETVSIKITVTDSNDAPVFDPDQIERGGFSIDATVPVGGVVGYVLASDEDPVSPNSDVTYEIETPVNVTFPFAIDAQGTVTVARSPDFRLTDRKVWPLTIMAVDGGTPPLTGSITVPVNVCGTCEIYDEL